MHRNPNADEIKCILEESRNVAVGGLSDSPFRTSHTIASAIQRAGYRIFPVTRTSPGRFWVSNRTPPFKRYRNP
jgi:predicted CoA-binding protein